MVDAGVRGGKKEPRREFEVMRLSDHKLTISYNQLQALSQDYKKKKRKKIHFRRLVPVSGFLYFSYLSHPLT